MVVRAVAVGEVLIAIMIVVLGSAVVGGKGGQQRVRLLGPAAWMLLIGRFFRHCTTKHLTKDGSMRFAFTLYLGGSFSCLVVILLGVTSTTTIRHSW